MQKNRRVQKYENSNISINTIKCKNRRINIIKKNKNIKRQDKK